MAHSLLTDAISVFQGESIGTVTTALSLNRTTRRTITIAHCTSITNIANILSFTTTRIV